MDNNQQARFNMIHQQIRPYEVTDNTIIEIMSQTPRQNFVPKAYQSVAYADTAIPLDDTNMMLQPKIVARALQALNLKEDETVLEIGTGTGYVTTLLSHLTGHVYSVEVNRHLYEIAQKNLQSGCANVTLELKDGVHGWEQHAPYHCIFVTGSFPVELPPLLLEQLHINGRCFAIIGKGPAMRATLFTKTRTGLIQDVLFETVAPALVNAPTGPSFTF